MHESPRISTIGMVSMDLVVSARSYPPEGAYSVVESLDRMPGGTTANSAVAAARLGANVSINGRVGQDHTGDELIAGLAAEGIETSGLSADSSVPTDETIIIVSASTGERTIFWKQGARITRRSKINFNALFSASICVIDVVDLALYRFLADLPVHTNPNARLLGSLNYLAASPESSLKEIIPRLDAVVGSSGDAIALTGASSTVDACKVFQQCMIGNNLRFAAITDGARGAYGIEPGQIHHVAAVDVEVVDTTGAGDAFAGALAYALGARWNTRESLSLCSVVAGLSTIRLGAQTGLPRMNEVQEILDSTPPLVTDVS